MKFQRSNQSTCFNQKPIVEPGDTVHAGDVIADGPATEKGELALGENILVAFMPWQGYNFEDSILVSERLTKRDHFTSVHIEEFECVARDTKLGKEEITGDIPNVGEEALKDLDESGIVRIGAEVKPNDILVGKITPKGETQLSPEEKLLRAIFGEKAGDVRDSSLRVPPGVQGIVIGARVFSRKGTEKDERAKDIEDQEKEKLLADQRDEMRIISESYPRPDGQVAARPHHRGAPGRRQGQGPRVPRAQKIDEPDARRDSRRATGPRSSSRARPMTASPQLAAQLDDEIKAIEELYRDKIGKLTKGDELPPGVIKMVKVYLAIKRKLLGRRQDGRSPRQQGRRLAGPPGRGHAVHAGRHPGRHRAQPARRSLAYERRADPRDPPRVGRARARQADRSDFARRSGRATPCAREAEEDLHRGARRKSRLDGLDDEGLQALGRQRQGRRALRDAGLRRRQGAGHPGRAHARRTCRPQGQQTLFDGRTGEPFDHDVTVGVMYMLKLHHLVDDKIHARSIGPYSLVTQQPLGGKAQFGGQRLGEMEVWAMEAYGAAYGLQEFLTVKSDDVIGRTRMYEAIVKGEHKLESGLPESFNVLLKELQSLCLNVELIEDPNAPRKQETTLELMAREVAAKVGQARRRLGTASRRLAATASAASE